MYTGQMHQNASMINEIHKSITITAENDVPQSLLYHYTSVKVVDSILENAKLWASNIHYLNDAEEYYRGITYLLNLFDNNKYQQIKQIIESIRMENGSTSEGVFSISFSSQEDSLHQWITYSKEAGACIGFDFDLLKQYYLILDTVYEEEQSNEVYGICSNVISQAKYINENTIIKKQPTRELILNAIVDFYDSLEKLNNSGLPSKKSVPMRTTLDRIKGNDMTKEQVEVAKQYFRLFASYCKNDAFRIEHEFRAAILPLFYKHQACAEINYFMMHSGVIRPYIKVGFLLEYNNTEINSLPIKSITIGPAENQQVVFDSVVHRIKYGKRKVWDYWKHRKEDDDSDVFWDNFIAYIIGALERYSIKNTVKISLQEIEPIMNQLWSAWCEENQVNQLLLPQDLVSRCILKVQQEDSNLLSKKKSNKQDVILKDIMHNNYFTAEGIWIRKSQIAYVF